MAVASKRTGVDDLLRSGRSNIAAMMSPVPKAVLEDNRSGPRPNCSADEPVENGLIGDEVLDTCKAAIEKDLRARVSIQVLPGWLRNRKRKRKPRFQHLSMPTGFRGDPDLLSLRAGLFKFRFPSRGACSVDPSC